MTNSGNPKRPARGNATGLPVNSGASPASAFYSKSFGGHPAVTRPFIGRFLPELAEPSGSAPFPEAAMSYTVFRRRVVVGLVLDALILGLALAAIIPAVIL